jgi:hypothetical protein
MGNFVLIIKSNGTEHASDQRFAVAYFADYKSAKVAADWAGQFDGVYCGIFSCKGGKLDA